MNKAIVILYLIRTGPSATKDPVLLINISFPFEIKEYKPNQPEEEAGD